MRGAGCSPGILGCGSREISRLGLKEEGLEPWIISEWKTFYFWDKERHYE